MPSMILRDRLAEIVREIRRDFHGNRKVRTTDEQIPRARAALSLERLIAQLDLEQAQEEYAKAEEHSKPGDSLRVLAQTLLERAEAAVARAQRLLHPEPEPKPELPGDECHIHDVALLDGQCLACVFNIPDAPLREIVPASEGVDAPSVPAANLRLVAGHEPPRPCGCRGYSCLGCPATICNCVTTSAAPWYCGTCAPLRDAAPAAGGLVAGGHVVPTPDSVR